MKPAPGTLVQRIHDALPQTQCQRCGWPDCAAYAHAIAEEGAAINRCPPGGAQGIARLAAITGQPLQPLSPDCGRETPRTLAVIDENWCIGCTLCIEVCPTDAILGAHKRMHTVIARWCTGCELCIPVCPVDCITAVNASGHRTGWNAWSETDAQWARQRWHLHQQRQMREGEENARHSEQAPPDHPADAPAPPDPQTLEKKRAVIESVLARARARKTPR